jgi:hypothetical protein
MSSLKQLESGEWRASVLLDNGHTVRRTFSAAEAAVAWSISVEEERDAGRLSRRSADIRRSIDTALATLRRHANHGRLSAADRSALERIRRIASTHPDVG